MYTQKKTIHNFEELPVLMDIPLAAQLLGINHRIVERYCRANLIKASKIARQWRINKHDLIQFIEERSNV